MAEFKKGKRITAGTVTQRDTPCEAENYYCDLRDRIVAAFNWDEADSGRITKNVRILLVTGQWLDGELRNDRLSTFTLRVSGGYRTFTDMEIPYHGVAAIERVETSE